jgi:hypothetical protein
MDEIRETLDKKRSASASGAPTSGLISRDPGKSFG